MKHSFFICLTARAAFGRTLLTTTLCALALAADLQAVTADSASTKPAWQPDLGDGRYMNPIIHADYSDPDVIRVDSDFYMVASSFNAAPGLPVLHSRDLVSWRIVGHVFDRQPPLDVFDMPQHGNGCWAPSLRRHDGWYFVYYGDPDLGIYMSKAKHPAGPWEPLRLIRAAKGWIDPCPFWDDDGNAYLVHAFAGSRASIKSILVINRMNAEGTELLDDGVLVFDGHDKHPTIEGPKMYKRNGYYYIFAPGGGVTNGWQTVLRSTNVYGPYADRIVMHQGITSVNGPHQGGWVELESGESWFVHFQDKGAYGRIVHLQPMTWKDDWPVIGVDLDGDGIGEPALTYQKPAVGAPCPVQAPQTSDEFNDNRPGLQWQWHANPRPTWMFMHGNQGLMRLYPVFLPESAANLWRAPNLFLQKFPAERFRATTKLDFHAHVDGDKTGLIVMGSDYAYVAIERRGGKLFVHQALCLRADQEGVETQNDAIEIADPTSYLRLEVTESALCRFSHSIDGRKFAPVGTPFQAKAGRWIGAKMGLFCLRTQRVNDSGYADFDWFRVEPLN